MTKIYIQSILGDRLRISKTEDRDARKEELWNRGAKLHSREGEVVAVVGS